MNQNLDKAIQGIARVDALMYAYERAFLSLEVEAQPEDRERVDMALSTFYVIWDTVREVAADLDRLDGDRLVVDAIYAVNDVRRRKSSLKMEE